MAFEVQIDARLADREIPDLQPLDAFRQRRAGKRNPALGRVDLEAERSLNQGVDRPGAPGLGGEGTGAELRTSFERPWHPDGQPGNPCRTDALLRFDHAVKDR